MSVSIPPLYYPVMNPHLKRQFRRMCNAHPYCSGCPLPSLGGGICGWKQMGDHWAPTKEEYVAILRWCNEKRVACCTQTRRRSLRRGIDVGMYQTLLEPAVSLDVESESLTDEQEQALWDRFDLTVYKEKLLELAVPLLEKQLARLPAEFRITLIPDSLQIVSPCDYSYGNDLLFFDVRANALLTAEEIQPILDCTASDDWEAEFGSQYRIYEQLSENYTIHDFQKEEQDD